MSDLGESQQTQTSTKPSVIPSTLGFLIALFGTFFLVATFFSLITIFVLRVTDEGAMSESEKYAMILTVSSFLTALGALYIGIKLIKRQDVGRKLFNIFSLIVIALAWLKFTYKQNKIAESYANIPKELAANAKQIELSDTLTIFILPILLLVVALLLNLKRSRAALH